jgi:hypothetical protein
MPLQQVQQVQQAQEQGWRTAVLVLLLLVLHQQKTHQTLHLLES